MITTAGSMSIACNNQPAILLRNTGRSPHHWIKFETVGTSSNRDGIGAKLRLITASGPDQHAMVSAAGSYLASNDKRVHFGIGVDRSIKAVEITWPSGVTQRLENITADRIVTLREPAGSPR
ncbi:MAG: ASPIC/UnbV domain-containing protein [Bryobacteraceae bacterium]